MMVAGLLLQPWRLTQLQRRPLLRLPHDDGPPSGRTAAGDGGGLDDEGAAPNLAQHLLAVVGKGRQRTV